ncbi:MAG: hypothetical protein Q7K29_01390 [Thermoleophilia bacterium]|nr:hypothetical protein [Thermoleophilia bacterium]
MNATGKIGQTKISTLLTAAIAAGLFVLALLPGIGCGDTADTPTATGSAATSPTSSTPQDRAAVLAAQAQLRNAQMAQETYYVENERYAATTAELKTTDVHLNPKIELVSGTARTYEMKITANDNNSTVFILRRTENRIERVDGEGNPW